MKKNGPAFGAIGSGAAGGDFTENQKNIIEFQTDPFDCWFGLVDLFAGPNHGLRVGVCISDGFELVEIIGKLPRSFRKGLRRHAPWSEREYAIEWVTRTDGDGQRYELHGMYDLLDRLVERKVFLGGGK